MNGDGTGRRELAYAISRVGCFWVALPASRVVQIYDTPADPDAAGAAERVLDLNELLGAPEDGGARRALRLTAATCDVVVVVGAKVEIVAVAAEEAMPLPDLVEDYYRRLGVTGFLARPQGLVCVLDADRLAAGVGALSTGRPA